MLDLRRLDLGVRELVTAMEQSLVDLLAGFDIEAAPKADAPGVYVAGDKIASLGLRVSRGCSFHGLALNVDMDMTPFSRINPCGYAGLKMVQMRDLLATPQMCIRDRPSPVPTTPISTTWRTRWASIACMTT